MSFLKMVFDLIEMVFDKIRWNVMGIAVIIAYLIVDFGNKLIDLWPTTRRWNRS